MKIIRAEKSHKDEVIRLLDEFRTACAAITEPEKNYVSTTARDSGGKLFDEIIVSPNSAIFLAVEDKAYVGIVTVNRIPQIRKGVYCAEIEEMFVEPEFQGTGAAQLLIDRVVDWAKKNNIKTVRLESGNELKRAHRFYEKAGFLLHAQAYEKKIA